MSTAQQPTLPPDVRVRHYPNGFVLVADDTRGGTLTYHPDRDAATLVAYLDGEIPASLVRAHPRATQVKRADGSTLLWVPLNMETVLAELHRRGLLPGAER